MARNALVAPLFALALAAGAASPVAAQERPATAALGKCLVDKTTAADKTLLVQWIFTVIALHPDVKQVASVDDAKREDLTKRTAKLYEVLIADRCLAEAREAIRTEGTSAFEASFKTLGEIAAGGLFTDPAVAAGSEKISKYLDSKVLENAFKP